MASPLPPFERGFQEQWIFLGWVSPGPGGASGPGVRPAIPVPVPRPNLLKTEICIPLLGKKQKCGGPLLGVGKESPQGTLGLDPVWPSRVSG